MGGKTLISEIFLTLFEADRSMILEQAKYGNGSC